MVLDPKGEVHFALVSTPVCVLHVPVQVSVASVPTFCVPVNAPALEHFRSTSTCAGTGDVMSNSPWCLEYGLSQYRLM